MNAAIYARKSTAQDGVADEAKSVTRQIENARAFAVSRGWRVDDTHVFVDDGISGAEFKRRPGFQRMLGAALVKKPAFTVLIVSEQKSIGREASETAFTIKQLAQAGIEIFEYIRGKSLTPKTAIDKILSNVQGFADETQREQTSDRVHETHTRLAKAGRVVGGRVFGYTNRDVFNGEDAHGRPLKSHVERVINPDEATVVRQIFEMYDAGDGLKKIAKQLNRAGAAKPKPFVRRDASKTQPMQAWSPSTVRAILSRDLYNGEIVWNKTRKRSAWGNVDQQPRPVSEWMRIPAPELRIVNKALWARVQARRGEVEDKAVRLTKGLLCGRPPKTPTQNLLAGLATCALCGGGLVVETSPRKRGRVPEYVCHRHRHAGTCSNKLHIRVSDMNEAVLQAIEQHALTPEAIEFVIGLSERDDLRDQQVALERERKDIAKRIARLTEAIETGGEVRTLVAKIRELEARRGVLDEQLSNTRPVPRLAPAVIEDRLSEWRRLLRQSTTTGRTVLQRILRGRIVFTPRTNPVSDEIDGYDFEAQTRFDKLFSGISVRRPEGLDPADRTGCEGIGPDDTWDRDFGALLDAVYTSSTKNCGKVLASPTGFEPVF